MTQRAPISKELAAAVMFASDRTCCVCRIEKHKTQIHHIDGNASNNEFENLAVICLHCHSDAHTTGAFVRNLTPELTRLYNSRWREIVKLRLTTPTDGAGVKELAAEAFLEASLDCHHWKNFLISLVGPNQPQGKPGEFKDVWDAMAELWIPPYSEENYRRFLALFAEGVSDVQRRFDRLLQLFADVLPPDFKTLLVRAHRQLDVERLVYIQLQVLSLAIPSPAEARNSFFYQRFIGVIQVLRDVAREADRRRELLFGAGS